MKKKQRDILTTPVQHTSSSPSTGDQSVHTSIKPDPPKKSVPSNLGSTNSGQPAQHQSSSNKMLNMFTNLIGRNKSSFSPNNQSFEALSPNSHNCSYTSTNQFDNIQEGNLPTPPENYSNLKHLKRATSSTHLKKNNGQAKVQGQKFGQMMLGHPVQPVILANRGEIGGGGNGPVNKLSFNPANMFNNRLSTAKQTGMGSESNVLDNVCYL